MIVRVAEEIEAHLSKVRPEFRQADMIRSAILGLRNSSKLTNVEDICFHAAKRYISFTENLDHSVKVRITCLRKRPCDDEVADGNQRKPVRDICCS